MVYDNVGKKEILKKIDKLLYYFENECKYEFRGASIIIICSHSDRSYDARIIDLEYMYELEDGQRDEALIKGLRNIREMIAKLFTNNQSL